MDKENSFLKLINKPWFKAIVVLVLVAGYIIIKGPRNNIVLKIILALLVFSVIVLVHEFGHYLLAKKNGIGVADFSIGMGPKIWSFKRGETTYAIRWLPLGGSCMMIGEEQDPENKREDSFNNKSVWARISVIAAGPVFNFILAFIFALGVVGVSGWDFAKIGVMDNMPAKEAGLKNEDIVKKINGKSIVCSRDMANQLQVFHPVYNDEPVKLVVERDGKKMDFTVTPKKVYVISGFSVVSDDDIAINEIQKDTPFDKAGLKDGDRVVGIDKSKIRSIDDFAKVINESIFNEVIEVSYVRGAKSLSEANKIADAGDAKKVKVTLLAVYKMGITYSQFNRSKDISALEIIKFSAQDVGYWIKSTIQSLGYLIGGKASRKDISGPVGIVKIIGDSYEESYEDGGAGLASLNLVYVSILLSANIGVMNLLPIPALDGGRLLLLIIEAIRRKKLKPEVEGIITAIGVILLLLLMVFVLFNDIFNIITG